MNAAQIASLTQRERDVLEQMVEGHQNKMIGYILDISPRTVEIHRHRVLKKLYVRNIPQLMRLIFDIDPHRKVAWPT